MVKNNPTIWNDKIHTLLLSLATAGLIGCFAFLWNLNATVAKLQEHDVNMAKSMDDVNGKMNNVQLNIQDMRERIVRIEAKQR